MARKPKCQILIECATHLWKGGSITTKWLRNKYEIPKATANRYMNEIERFIPVCAVVEGRSTKFVLLNDGDTRQ